MPRINILDSETINKIAAGEVVERPKAVIKELVENSIDAGAKSISIEIQDGGKKLIRVTDDGVGIDKEDIRLAFERHCTSKISYADQLSLVRTLGFRGEALSSIAAVSRVELISKQEKDLLGSRYIIEGGKEVLFEEVGVPNGTTIIAKDIFFNTPARLKFLKSSNSEAGQIGDIVEKIVLSHPEISFKYYVNGRLKISTSGNGNIKDIIYSLYGKEVSSQLIDVQGEFDGIRIKGYIAKPLMAKANRVGEIYFVNGRFVKNFSVNNAIEAGYYGRMMQGKFPIVFLYMDISPDLINVNIHPTKMEIKFNNEQDIANFISDSIRNVLDKSDIIPDMEPIDYVQRKDVIKILEDEKSKYEVEKKAEPFEVKRKENEIEENTILFEKPKQMNFFEFDETEQYLNVKIIGQVFRTYWIVEIEDTMFIMDQHAAHEKVLFEELMREYRNKKFISQELAIPIQINLSSEEESVLIENKMIFSQFGFDIEYYGGNTYILRAVPFNLYHMDMQDIFSNLLSDLCKDKTVINNDKIYIKLATMACKAAIKGNNSITEFELKKLVSDLMKLENPYQCPHGRPTVIRMTKKEIEKIFARIV